MTKDVVTFSQAKLIASVVGAVLGVAVTFYGGIELAKAHADEKVKELRQEVTSQIKDIKVKIEEGNERLARMDKSIVRIETLLEERFENRPGTQKNDNQQ